MAESTLLGKHVLCRVRTPFKEPQKFVTQNSEEAVPWKEQCLLAESQRKQNVREVFPVTFQRAREKQVCSRRKRSLPLSHIEHPNDCLAHSIRQCLEGAGQSEAETVVTCRLRYVPSKVPAPYKWLATLTAVPLGLSSNPGEDMEAASPLEKLVEGEERWEAPDFLKIGVKLS
ncbi:hypothetical protein TNCV_1845491 [Trichonephila clavipes]|nr:hypothetical protein TNCV_1845491 [Trichonephila clavipes]